MGIKINISWNLTFLMETELDFQKEETLKEFGSFYGKNNNNIHFKFIKMEAEKNFC